MQKFDLIISKNVKDLEWVRKLFAIDGDTLPESCLRLSGFQEILADI